MKEKLTGFVAGQTVIWHQMKCIVTNGSIAKGKYIQISPVGNGTEPAKYYTIHADEIRPSIQPLNEFVATMKEGREKFTTKISAPNLAEAKKKAEDAAAMWNAVVINVKIKRI